jgi:hypothetical protein
MEVLLKLHNIILFVLWKQNWGRIDKWYIVLPGNLLEDHLFRKGGGELSTLELKLVKILSHFNGIQSTKPEMQKGHIL